MSHLCSLLDIHDLFDSMHRTIHMISARSDLPPLFSSSSSTEEDIALLGAFHHALRLVDSFLFDISPERQKRQTRQTRQERRSSSAVIEASQEEEEESDGDARMEWNLRRVRSLLDRRWRALESELDPRSSVSLGFARLRALVFVHRIEAMRMDSTETMAISEVVALDLRSVVEEWVSRDAGGAPYRGSVAEDEEISLDGIGEDGSGGLDSPRFVEWMCTIHPEVVRVRVALEALCDERHGDVLFGPSHQPLCFLRVLPRERFERDARTQ